jgi:glycosyltransferase involved in cell wall biosynthesis
VNETHFTILIPAYNCEKWVHKNLSSALNQSYDKFDVFYIDDNSTDNTWHLVSEYNNENLKSIRNSFNKGKMENVFYAVNSMQDDTVVIILDGDDWLPHNNVLKFLNNIYQSGDIWMTNGSYIIEPTKQIIKPRLNDFYWNGNIRQKSWEFSHLGTFKKKLFSKIKKKHFMNRSGQFWSTTSDQAIMWPMAEMSGPEHHKAIDEVLYVYNRLNPLSDDRIYREDQLLTEALIRSIKPYSRLQSL